MSFFLPLSLPVLYSNQEVNGSSHVFLHTHARTHSLELVLPATFDSILARFFIYNWRIPLLTILRLILFCFIRHASDLIWTLMVGSDVYLVLTVSFHKNILSPVCVIVKSFRHKKRVWPIIFL